MKLSQKIFTRIAPLNSKGRDRSNGVPDFPRERGQGRGGIGPRRWLSTSIVLHLAIGLASVVHAQNQATNLKKPPPSQPVGGYLSKTSPSGLRFAAPPRPPVAYLPPLPITYDPQPVFTPEFANGMSEIPHPPNTNTNAIVPPPPPAPSLPEIASILATNRQGKIPVGTVDVGAVSPQMLLRFFQNGQPGDVQMLMNNPVPFTVPVREDRHMSTATYEVK